VNKNPASNQPRYASSTTGMASPKPIIAAINCWRRPTSSNSAFFP
jgi:hypothetical protein